MLARLKRFVTRRRYTPIDYKIKRIYHLENDTIQYKLAQESLIVIYDPKTPCDHTAFTDDGDLTLSTLYADLCQAYNKEIRQEEYRRLRILPVTRKRRKP